MKKKIAAPKTDEKALQETFNYLSELEKIYANELDCVLYYDLETFTTEYLQRLQTKWRTETARYKKLLHRLLVLVAVSPIFLVLGIIAALTTDNFWLPTIALLFPLAVTFFFWGLLRLHQRFGSSTRQTLIGERLERELRRRRQSPF